jgi:hypothetical protein
MGQAILDMEIEDQVADAMTSGDFCFNHIIGLPNKKCTNVQNKPSLIIKRWFLFDTLQQHKHIW